VTTHPLERWPANGRRAALAAAIVAALAMWALIATLDGPLRDTGDGTVDLEVAGTHDRAEAILDGWRADDLLANGAFINGLDLLFPLLYVPALAGGCVAAATAWRRRGNERLAEAGIAIAWLATLAGALDWIENLALAVVILDGPSSPWPQLAFGAAIPKFAGTAAALVYALAGGATLVGRGRTAI
jgi:hypothetical protein